MAATQADDQGAAHRALGELCQIYWYPIYCYLRSRGSAPADAEDLTQEFFADLIRRDSLATAAAERGKLRAFLLTAVKNFAINDHRKRTAAKRGGGVQPLSIDASLAERRLALEPADRDAPDLLFERAWARTLLDHARAELAAAYAKADKAELSEALAPYVGSEEEEPPYRDLADELSMSVGSLRVAVFRMRQKFRSILEREIADTLTDPSEIDAEIGYLVGIFAGA